MILRRPSDHDPRRARFHSRRVPPRRDFKEDLLETFASRASDPLGEGGMGVVFNAEQLEPARRVVAVELIKLGMDSKSMLAQFDLERRARDCGTTRLRRARRGM